MKEIEKSMYYGAKPFTIAAAKILRDNMIRLKYEFKVPPGGFRGGFCWQSWRAATRNPVEALRYE